MTDNNRTATVAPPPVSRLTRAQRRALDARARIEAQRADDQIALERLEARREHMRARAELAAERRRLADEARQARRAAKAQARTRWRTAAAAAAVRLGRRIVLTGTNVGVNGVAVVGQVLALAGVGWPIWAAVAAAVVIESVAIYVGWHAHVALVEGDSAARIRLVSYGIGLAVAWLNYSHNDPRVAWLYAGCSAASPWLWAMHSRHVHRKQLRAEGLIDPRAPKFSALRWALHPAETAAALWWAVGEGIQSPAVAIAAVRQRRHAAAARDALDEGHAALQDAAAAALQLAVEVLDDTPSDTPGDTSPPVADEVAAAVANLSDFPARARALLAMLATIPDTPTDTPAATTPPVAPVVSLPAPDDDPHPPQPDPADPGPTPDDDDNATKVATMRRYWDEQMEKGVVPSGAELARAAGAHPSLGRRKRREWLDEVDGRKRRGLLSRRRAATA